MRVFGTIWDVARICALALGVGSGVPAQAATFSFDFDISLEAEHVYVVDVAPPKITHSALDQAGGVDPIASALGWRELSELGLDQPIGAFGLTPDDVGQGSLRYVSPFAYDLTINDQSVWTQTAWIAALDPSLDAAVFTFAMPGEQHQLDFIEWTGSTLSDARGTLTSTDGTRYQFLGYSATFTLAPTSAGGASEVAAIPLPAGAVLLATALGALRLRAQLGGGGDGKERGERNI